MTLYAKLLAAACAASLGVPAAAAPDAPPPTRSNAYLHVWAGDADEKDSDFLAVVDADVNSATYGQVVATAPVGAKGTMPHHIEYETPPGGMLFANGWKAGHSFVFDLSDPLRPRLAADFKSAAGYTFPHSFARLPNGNIVATFQSIGPKYAPPGGLVELDSAGLAVRSTPSTTPEFPDEINWPYSLAVDASSDRVITTSTDMGMGPGWKSPPTSHVQIWSVSELKLLSSLALPNSGKGDHHVWPAEPRLLSDGTVYVNTFTCGLYRVDGIRTDKPVAKFVHAFPGGTSEHDMCAVPIVYGKYWIQTVGALNGLVVLDVSDPDRPLEVSRFALPARFHMPHWLAADRSNGRLAVTGASDSWVLMLKFDETSGQLSIDQSFGGGAGVSFDRADWPHGRTGKAVVHGTVFGG